MSDISMLKWMVCSPEQSQKMAEFARYFMTAYVFWNNNGGNKSGAWINQQTFHRKIAGYVKKCWSSELVNGA